MALKKLSPPASIPDSPEKLIYDLPRRKIKGLLIHQGEMLKAYKSDALSVTDVALQLPTGSGKTLVGLLIAEWRRRKFKERIVFLCPTNQLVNQVITLANEEYGLTVHGFTGKISKYDPAAKAQYHNGDSIAVTSYSALFNTHPFFENPDVVILDDSHVAENYISSMWSFRVDRLEPKHSSLHTALANILKPYLDHANYLRLIGNVESITDATWADKLPTPVFIDLQNELLEVIDTHVKHLDLKYPWAMVREHLMACHLYMSPQDILIRPIIPPTWTHDAFNNAKQRIFMSATLGLSGDLERLTGRKKILRLPIPDGWDRQGIGRRFFMMPGLSLNEQEVTKLKGSLMKIAGRSLVLVPSDSAAREIKAHIEKLKDFEVYTADDLLESKKQFRAEKKAVAVLANRYDGIDFPGDDCRLLFIDGLPKATNTQERFLIYRMGAIVLFNERIQTRMLQAIGRCTRSSEDYSAIIILGQELIDYLVNPKRYSFLHPELQAEIKYGIEQSKEATGSQFVEFLKIFLENGKDWEEANNDIVALRDSVEQQSLPAIQNLKEIAPLEIEYQEKLWQRDFEEAFSAAEAILGRIGASELRGYRALWHYLAGSAALLDQKQAKAKSHFKQAKNAAIGIPWLVSLSKYQNVQSEDEQDRALLWKQVERMEEVISNLGTTNSRRYDSIEKEILDGLDGRLSFEHAHRLVGELIGFDSQKIESEGSPDPWWSIGDMCFVFEDHADAKKETVLDVKKARQVSTHPNWMREHAPLDPNTILIPVLVSPITKAKEGAMPHLRNVYLWKMDDFKNWAKTAVLIVRELRRKFIEPGDPSWKQEAADLLEQNKLDARSLQDLLKSNVAYDKLESVQ
jgi:hypothetical protein